jgi:hypothetical protein
MVVDTEADMAVDTEVDMASASADAAAAGAGVTPVSPADTFAADIFTTAFATSGSGAAGFTPYSGHSCWRWYPGIYGYVRVWVC